MTAFTLFLLVATMVFTKTMISSHPVPALTAKPTVFPKVPVVTPGPSKATRSTKKTPTNVFTKVPEVTGSVCTCVRVCVETANDTSGTQVPTKVPEVTKFPGSTKTTKRTKTTPIIKVSTKVPVVTRFPGSSKTQKTTIKTPTNTKVTVRTKVPEVTRFPGSSKTEKTTIKTPNNTKGSTKTMISSNPVPEVTITPPSLEAKTTETILTYSKDPPLTKLITVASLLSAMIVFFVVIFTLEACHSSKPNFSRSVQMKNPAFQM